MNGSANPPINHHNANAVPEAFTYVSHIYDQNT